MFHVKHFGDINLYVDKASNTTTTKKIRLYGKPYSLL